MFSIFRWYLRQRLAKGTANAESVAPLLEQVFEEVHARKKLDNPLVSRDETSRDIRDAVVSIREKLRGRPI